MPEGQAEAVRALLDARDADEVLRVNDLRTIVSLAAPMTESGEGAPLLK